MICVNETEAGAYTGTLQYTAMLISSVCTLEQLVFKNDIPINAQSCTCMYMCVIQTAQDERHSKVGL